MEKEQQRLPSIFVDGFFQFLVLLLLFIALLNNQMNLAVLAICTLTLIYGAKLWCAYSLKGISCKMLLDKKKAFPGESLSLIIQVENAKLLPVWLQLVLRVSPVLLPSDSESVFKKDSGLFWFQRVSYTFDLVAKKRGFYLIESPVLRVGDLLGFFNKEKKEKQLSELLVYPRVFDVAKLSQPLQEFFGEQKVKSPVEDPMFPMGTRMYHHGRPARHIHWKASTRQQFLQEKVFESTSQAKSLLAVDVAQYINNKDSESFEHALEAVASLAARLDRDNIPFGFLSNGLLAGGGLAAVTPGSDPQQLARVLENLARLQMNASEAMSQVLEFGITYTGNLNCLYFCHALDNNALATGMMLQSRWKVPVMFFVNQTSPKAGVCDNKVALISEIISGGGSS